MAWGARPGLKQTDRKRIKIWFSQAKWPGEPVRD